MTHYEITKKIEEVLECTPLVDLARNIDSKPFVVGDKSPLFVCETTNKDNSYILSLYTAYCSYPQSELEKKEKSFLVGLGYSCVTIFGKLLLFFRANKIISLGNHLVSTNFYPEDFASTIKNNLRTLITHYQNHFFVIRSLERIRYARLIQELKNEGWIILPARIVYIFNFSQLSQRKKRSDTKKDMKLLSSHPYTVCTDGFDDDDFTVMHTLYNNVYIDKHSSLNALYSSLFFKECFAQKIIKITAYRDEHSKIIAFVAIFECENILSTPALGYDTSLPSEWGLYRLVCGTLLKMGELESKDVNFSSGADEFKQRRGGRGTLEYTAIYCAHLPLLTRLFFKTIAKVLTPLGLWIEKRMSLPQ